MSIRRRIANGFFFLSETNMRLTHILREIGIAIFGSDDFHNESVEAWSKECEEAGKRAAMEIEN